jgi:hypothetical protein
LASLDITDHLTPAVKAMSGSLDKLDARLGKSSTRAYKAGQQIGTGIKNSVAIIGAATVAAGAVVGGLFLKSISMASDLSETVSKAGVVFGSARAKVLALGDTSATSLGISKNAAIGAAATFGNLLVSMGLAQTKSADMSVSLVNLAADLASFNNIDPGEALEKLRAGLTGEAEPLKTLGINLNEQLLKQKAVELGLVTLTKGQKNYTAVLPPAIKAQAAFALIMEQSKTAQGDVARTSDGLANQTRFLAAQWEDLQTAFAGAALPGVAKILKAVNKAFKDNAPAIQKFGDQISALFSDANIATGTKLIGDMFQAAQDAAPVLQSAAGTVVTLVRTSVDLFRSLPPEIQALAVAGLAINKLTGGLVTNIAGGLISAVISSFKGLMNVNAAVVNVNGPVAGGPGDVVSKVAGGVSAAAVAAVAASALASAAVVAATKLLITDNIDPGLRDAVNGVPGAGTPLGNRDPRRFDRNGQVVTNVLKDIEVTGDRSYDAIENARRDANRKDDRTYDSIEKLRSGTQLVDVTNGSALAADIATAVSRKADVAADLAARGIKSTGPSKTIAPRLKFLAEAHSGEKDVAVANALASGFEKGKGPAFRNTQALKDAIKAVSKDIKTLPPKFTGPLRTDLNRLKAELARREAINVTVPVTNTVTINGREVTANLGRYVTIVNGTPTGGSFGG